MRVVRYERFGDPDVLHFAERDAPQAGPGEVVVAPVGLAVNPKDVVIRRGRWRHLPWVRLPLTPGHDLAGPVVSVGPGVDLSVGQTVFGFVDSWTGGASAERVVLKAHQVAPIPATLDPLEAAAIPLAGQTALQALRDEARVQPGDHVVVNGASGGVGSFAVQIARILGARVTAVCLETNHALVRSLGANAVVDYRQRDPRQLTGVDVFFDVFGRLTWSDIRPTLTAAGRAVGTIPRSDTILRGGLARLGLHRYHLVVVHSRREDLVQLATWVDDHRLRPVIETVLPWEDLGRAHAMVETKHTRGKVVVEVTPAEGSA